MARTLQGRQPRRVPASCRRIAWHHRRVPRAPFRLTVRTSGQVARGEHASLEEALEAAEVALREVRAFGAARRAPVDLKVRRFEPGQQTSARVEVHGPRGAIGGIDVRGDGTMLAWTGRIRKRPVEPQGDEDALAALRRRLA